jgi:hypothetical protein
MSRHLRRRAVLAPGRMARAAAVGREPRAKSPYHEWKSWTQLTIFFHLTAVASCEGFVKGYGLVDYGRWRGGGDDGRRNESRIT